MKYMIYVGNLNYKMDEHDVKKLFSPYGYVVSAQIIKKDDGLKSGIAFVQMGEKKQMEKAIKELDGKVVLNRTLKVSVAKDRFANSPALEKKKKVKKEEESKAPVKKKKNGPVLGLAVLKQYQKEKKKQN